MSTHLTEEEQVEALKKWWQENGKSLIVGAVLGLGGIFGWQSWTQHQATQSELASVRFENLHQAARNDQLDAVQKQAQIIQDEHKKHIYSDFAHLDLAKVQADQGDAAGAAQTLQQVADNSGEQAVRLLAQLRLARLKLIQGDAAGAGALLDQLTDNAYRGEVLALRGDIARARGDTQQARRAYADALAANAGNAGLIRMKLDELGGDPDEAEAS